MAGFIKAKRAKNLEKPEDKVGGFTSRPSGVYDAVIELAYGISSQAEDSDAQAMVIQCKLADGSKFYDRIWFSGADGNVYTQNDSGVKKYKKGFLIADALVNLATEGEEDLFNTEMGEATVKQKRDGKDVNVKVPTFEALQGFPVKLALIRTEKYKQNLVDGKYVDTDELITTSVLDNVFDEEGFTWNEWDAEEEEPKFIEEWEATWKDKDRKAPKKREEPKGLRKSSSSDGSTAKTRVAARKGLRR